MLPFLVHLFYIWIIKGKFSFACLRLAAFLCSCCVSVFSCLFVLADSPGCQRPSCLPDSFLSGFLSLLLIFPDAFSQFLGLSRCVPLPIERAVKELQNFVRIEINLEFNVGFLHIYCKSVPGSIRFQTSQHFLQLNCVISRQGQVVTVKNVSYRVPLCPQSP